MSLQVAQLSEIQTQLKVYHWQAPKHSIHVVLGDAYDEFDTKIDEYVEVCMGRSNNETSIITNKYVLTIQGYSELGLHQFIDNTLTFLRKDLVVEFNGEEQSNLVGLRDDMINLFCRVRYLLKMCK